MVPHDPAASSYSARVVFLADGRVGDEQWPRLVRVLAEHRGPDDEADLERASVGIHAADRSGRRADVACEQLPLLQGSRRYTTHVIDDRVTIEVVAEPQEVTLRFEGTDSTKAKHSFEVTLEKLMSRSDGMVIGRSADQCEFVLAHPIVSRRHARLRVTGEALQVEDLGSTNGTRVGEQALKAGEPMALHAGDKLRIGDVDMLVRHL